jgi:hypothetical protein
METKGLGAMLAQSHFSHTELHKKNKSDMHEMLHTKGVNWADLQPKWKNGSFLFKDGREWKTLSNLVLTRDERPVVGNLFDYLIWDKDKAQFPVDVFAIER